VTGVCSCCLQSLDFVLIKKLARGATQHCVGQLLLGTRRPPALPPLLVLLSPPAPGAGGLSLSQWGLAGLVLAAR
jgi:hypothetical protein